MRRRYKGWGNLQETEISHICEQRAIDSIETKRQANSFQHIRTLLKRDQLQFWKAS